MIKTPRWVGFFLRMKYGTLLYRDYFISHYKDPYEPTSTLECHEGFVIACCQMNFGGDVKLDSVDSPRGRATNDTWVEDGIIAPDTSK